MKRRTQQRPGVVLLLALILMAAIVASSIAIATAIADSAHQSKNLDDFVVASLAADSGLERSLSMVQAGRTAGASIVSATSNAGQTKSALVSGSQASVSVVAASSKQPISIPSLQPNQSVTFDYLGYDPTSGSLRSISGASKITIIGDAQHCTISPTPTSPAPCNGQLDISWYGLDNGGQPFYSGRTTLNSSQLDGQTSRTIDLLSGTIFLPETDTSQTNINNTTGFRITVRAIDVTHQVGLTAQQSIQQLTVKNITLTPSNLPTCGSGGTLPDCVTGVIGLTSTGFAGSSQSIKQASVLWQRPASALFNFVVFTEGDIIPAN